MGKSSPIKQQQEHHKKQPSLPPLPAHLPSFKNTVKARHTCAHSNTDNILNTYGFSRELSYALPVFLDEERQTGVGEAWLLSFSGTAGGEDKQPGS